MSFDLQTQRHSFAHLLAQWVQRYIDPQAQLWTGPAIDTWCYYDIAFSNWVEFGEKDLKQLTKNIQRLANEKQTYVRYDCSLDEWYEINTLTNQTLKNELLDKFKENGETKISYYLNVWPKNVLEHIRDTKDGYKEMYQTVTAFFVDKWTISEEQSVLFLDLCAWPHVEDLKEDLNPTWFKCNKLSGAYRQADADNQSMTRIYADIFENKEALKAHETMMEEARKRDHRVLGQQLKLFTVSPLIGSWLPLMQPNGMILRSEIENYLRELHKNKWYDKVWTPHLAKEDLYVCSGHADKFGDELFRVQWKEEKFFMKPMNCPHHMQLFADNQFSYRDMPVRYFEPATVYRDEKSGQLSGLTRVRAITQDDGHLFCRIGQIEEEVGMIVDIIKEFYTTLWMVDEYWVQLSVRGDDGKMYLWSDEVWETAESALENAAQANNLPYKRVWWEAAFYWPKLDFMFKDAIGRERQLATIQCDFNLPERFDLSFVNEQGEKERPVVIHRAIAWSLERFMWVMIEHFAWAFPVWLAPVQAIIVPVAEAFNDYANEVKTKLVDAWVRASYDSSTDSLNKKVRNAEKQKIPYILVVWEKEMTDGAVNVRSYKTKEQKVMDTNMFMEKVVSEYIGRGL